MKKAMKSRNTVYAGYWMDKWTKKAAKKASHKVERQAAKKEVKA